jgi:hypothetical protein
MKETVEKIRSLYFLNYDSYNTLIILSRKNDALRKEHMSGARTFPSGGAIDADGHMPEPPHRQRRKGFGGKTVPGLWAERLDPAFRDRAPRVVNEWKGKRGEFRREH